MDLLIHKTIKNILKTLNENGYEAYIVGGCIRDFYLNKTPSDYDITTNANYEEIKQVFSNYKIFEMGTHCGTVILRMDSQNVEITSFRGENANSLLEDLKLRDFTINSLAYGLKEGIVDYCNSLDDIKNRLIRINGEDDINFKLDPLRILRAIRLASSYNFDIETRTKKYMFENKELLKSISKERINQEFSKLILNKNSYIYIRKYFEIFSIFIPQLLPMKSFKQHNPYHKYDVLEHSLMVLKNIRNREVYLCLSALFHDIGKPSTFSIDTNGVGHFYGHEAVSVKIANEILRELKYDNETINKVKLLIMYHDYKIDSNKIIKKILRKLNKELIFDLYDLKSADAKGQSDLSKPNLILLKTIVSNTKKIIEDEECFNIKDLEITGYDLHSLNIPKGKMYKIILEDVLDKVISNTLNNNKDDLLKYINDTYKGLEI